jgi:hypothetical protein
MVATLLAKRSSGGGGGGGGDAGMPQGWEEQRTAGGRPFFIDHNSKETTWDRPTAAANEPSPAGSAHVTTASEETAIAKENVRCSFSDLIFDSQGCTFLLCTA